MTLFPKFCEPQPLPEWLRALPDWEHFHSPQELMTLAIRIATASAQNHGGPFGAVISDSAGRLIEIGWNYVVEKHNSTHHAEVCGIRRAQQRLSTHDLAQYPELALYCSSAPCIQCYGAIYWSGLKQIYSGASLLDAESYGFDEGPISMDLWEQARLRRGIEYVPEFHAGLDPLEPFRAFQACGGRLY